MVSWIEYFGIASSEGLSSLSRFFTPESSEKKLSWTEFFGLKMTYETLSWSEYFGLGHSGHSLSWKEYLLGLDRSDKRLSWSEYLTEYFALGKSQEPQSWIEYLGIASSEGLSSLSKYFTFENSEKPLSWTEYFGIYSPHKTLPWREYFGFGHCKHSFSWREYLFGSDKYQEPVSWGGYFVTSEAASWTDHFTWSHIWNGLFSAKSPLENSGCYEDESDRTNPFLFLTSDDGPLNGYFKMFLLTLYIFIIITAYYIVLQKPSLLRYCDGQKKGSALLGEEVMAGSHDGN